MPKQWFTVDSMKVKKSPYSNGDDDVPVGKRQYIQYIPTPSEGCFSLNINGWRDLCWEKKQDRIHEPECRNGSYVKTATLLSTLSYSTLDTLATLVSANLATLATLLSATLATLATGFSGSLATLATLNSSIYATLSSSSYSQRTLAPLAYSS